jgi:hypothetical protein
MELCLSSDGDCQLTTDELCLSDRWQPHYRYREMELCLSNDGDCQLTTD